jgi:uncharacterized protein DUF6894
MPYYHFDLVVGVQHKSQGGVILEDCNSAIDRADRLAGELSVVRPDLCAAGGVVRVTDEDKNELYRTALERVE